MRIFTPMEVAQYAGTKYRGILVAAKFARMLNEFPKDQLPGDRHEKLTTRAFDKLVSGELSYREIRRRRAEA